MFSFKVSRQKSKGVFFQLIESSSAIVPSFKVVQQGSS
jgi:hypothetical protein